MAVKLRLKRMGKKKHPTYRVVAADARAPRDGRFIELIGRYDPHPDPSVVEIDNDLALKWLEQGAQPTAQVRKLLEISGAWGRFRVARGDIHTIPETPAPPVAAPAPGHQPEIHVVGGSEDEAPPETPAEEAVVVTEPVAAETDEAPTATADEAEPVAAAATDGTEDTTDEEKEANGAEG